MTSVIYINFTKKEVEAFSVESLIIKEVEGKKMFYSREMRFELNEADKLYIDSILIDF
jgi:hypothetical protein